MRPFARSTVLAFVAAATLALPLHAAPRRVVAIGDIHGEYEGFVSILKHAELVDDELRWKAGETTLVQIGDFLDRGADVRKVMDLLMALERDAERKRGRVVVLLGNHEVMNLTSVFGNVNPVAYAAFVDQRSEKRRADGYRKYAALHRAFAKRYGDVSSLPVLSESEWLKAHPPGFMEYQEAAGRKGKYGRWLREKQAITKIDRTVFVHGGVSPELGSTSLDEINRLVRLEIEGFDRLREYLVGQKLILPFFTQSEIANVLRLEAERIASEDTGTMQRFIAAFNALGSALISHPQGPLWFRGYAEWSEEEGARQIGPLLARFDARRFVVGHTVTADTSSDDAAEIRSRFGGKVFLIDTGMLRGYVRNGRPSALEIIGDDVTAIYESGRVTLRGRALGETPAAYFWRGPKDTVLPFRTAAEVVDFRVPAVSPDEAWVLYSRWPRPFTELMRSLGSLRGIAQTRRWLLAVAAAV